MNNFNLPIKIVEILNLIADSGYEGVVVGGAVRDMIMGKIPTDYDIATNAGVEQMEKLFNNYKMIKTGLKHGTVTLHVDDMDIEITTFRDKDVTLRGDLLLRDFTINSIAYSLKKGLIDYYNGFDDIKNKIIRINGDDDSRFREDPLRILRAIRLSAALKFEIDTLTEQCMFNDMNLLDNVSFERIREELSKLLVTDNCSSYIRRYFDILTVFMPELIIMKGFEQHNPHHIYDCLEHTLKVIDNTPKDLVLRLVALFHDSGKPASFTMDERGIGHFYNHFKISIDIAEAIMQRLKYSNDMIADVSHLIYYHDYPLTLTTKSLKKLLNYFGNKDIERLLAIKRADIMGQNPDYADNLKTVDLASKMINSIISDGDCFSLDRLEVNGKDLISIGIIKGKDIGYVLNQLLELVIKEEIANEHDKLLIKAQEIVRSKGEL